MKGLIKDIIISILIVACIFLILSVILYNKISISKVIPKSEEYQISNEMQEALNDSAKSENKEFVTTYSIGASDLKKYEATKEYVKGKKNPFAVESTGNGSNSNNTTGETDENSSSSDRFYEDDGTK